MEDIEIEVVEEVKLLGVLVRSDLRWTSNSEAICRKGYTRLWMLRRLKELGAETAELIDVYKQQVLSVLEFAVPVWASSITKHEASTIERVQKTALHIILGIDYTNYQLALKTLNMKSLSERRLELCSKFAVKSLRSQKYNTWFKKSEAKSYNTRCEKPIFKEVVTRTKRFYNSPIPYLTRLLNLHKWTTDES